MLFSSIKSTVPINRRIYEFCSGYGKEEKINIPYFLLIMMVFQISVYVSICIKLERFSLDVIDLQWGCLNSLDGYKLITFWLIHLNPYHLIGSLSMECLFCDLEKKYGSYRIGLIYLVSGLFSSIVSCRMGQEIIIGPSGGVYGLITLYFLDRINNWTNLTVGFSLILFVIIVGVYISNSLCYLLGFVSGILPSLLVFPNIHYRKIENHIALITILFWLVEIGLIIACVK